LASARTFYSSRPDNYSETPWPDRWPRGWQTSKVVGRYCLEVANDVFNATVAVTSCWSATLLACVAQHRTVGSLGTVVASDEWAAGRRCTVAALQPPLSTRLAGAWCLLVVRHLRRCAHSPKGDHDGHARRISVYFNSTQTVGPSRHTWRPRSCPGLGSGSWSRRARGGPGAASGWAVGAGAAGHVAAPELPPAGSGSWGRRSRGGAEAHLSREARFGATACVASRGYMPCSLP
jgi:hypothetical protein